jgi:hypothetical protein
VTNCNPYIQQSRSCQTTHNINILDSYLVAYKSWCNTMYRVQQKYLTVLQNSCEWNCWRGKFVLERPTSEAQSISVVIERWSVEHRAFAVETYFKNNNSLLTQRIISSALHWNECP